MPQREIIQTKNTDQLFLMRNPFMKFQKKYEWIDAHQNQYAVESIKIVIPSMLISCCVY